MKSFIPVAAPALVGNEMNYVQNCLKTGWISSCGEYVEQFEHKFAEFCNVNHALSCCNGTAALHLALLALDIGPGDEVIVPTLTFVATANAVSYCGATPVFIDSEPQTWNLDTNQIEGLITERTKAIIVVHLYGHPADMDPIKNIAKKHSLWVIEDAAEAHGAEYKGEKVGSLGDIATFSFYGNKIITTGEGGMITTNNSELAQKMLQLKGQGMDPHHRYWFPIIGYNYRLTNIASAIGLAQLEKIEWHIARKREIAKNYVHQLKDIGNISFQPEMPWAKNVYWMSSILLDENCIVSRDQLMNILGETGIETRPVFYPMHTLPIYREKNKEVRYPVAEHIASKALNLPSGVSLTEKELSYICSTIKQAVQHIRPIS